MVDWHTDSVPESFEEMTTGQQEDWMNARGHLARERPEARMILRQKFASMSVDDRRAELVQAQEALSNLDQADQIGDSHEEEPLERDYRIRMEETVRILTTDPDLAV